MREQALSTIFTASALSEAEAMIDWLRMAGLHPAELGLTAPVPFEHEDSKFPIQVPVEEAEKARTALANHSPFNNA